MGEAEARGPVTRVRRAPRVGVLALQGDFAAHERALRHLGLVPVEVRSGADLDSVDGLVLPGGESTTILTLLAGNGLSDRLRDVIAGGLPTLATCAGVILLAREVRSPAQASLGLLDAVAERNAYGRQVDSVVVEVDAVDPTAMGAKRLEAVFIRAPRLTAVGPGVEVLARRGDDPVLVRQDRILAATFHPELSQDSPVYSLFGRDVGGDA